MEPDFDRGQQGNTAIARIADDSSTNCEPSRAKKKTKNKPEISWIWQKVSAPRLQRDSSVLKQQLYVVDSEQLVWWQVRMQVHLKHLLKFGKGT